MKTLRTRASQAAQQCRSASSWLCRSLATDWEFNFLAGVMSFARGAEQMTALLGGRGAVTPAPQAILVERGPIVAPRSLRRW